MKKFIILLLLVLCGVVSAEYSQAGGVGDVTDLSKVRRIRLFTNKGF